MSAEVRSLLFVACPCGRRPDPVFLLADAAPGSRFLSFGLALIFGGAVGNLVDRIRFGSWWISSTSTPAPALPAFNVADSAHHHRVGIFAYHICL